MRPRSGGINTSRSLAAVTLAWYDAASHALQEPQARAERTDQEHRRPTPTCPAAWCVYRSPWQHCGPCDASWAHRRPGARLRAHSGIALQVRRFAPRTIARAGRTAGSAASPRRRRSGTTSNSRFGEPAFLAGQELDDRNRRLARPPSRSPRRSPRATTAGRRDAERRTRTSKPGKAVGQRGQPERRADAEVVHHARARSRRRRHARSLRRHPRRRPAPARPARPRRRRGTSRSTVRWMRQDHQGHRDQTGEERQTAASARLRSRPGWERTAPR